MKLHLIRIQQDFLWSVRLGAQLRIFSYDQDYVYQWAIWSQCGNFLTRGSTTPPCAQTCEHCQLNREERRPDRQVFKCPPGYLVLGRPDVHPNSRFWVLTQADVQKQIDTGKLLVNTIPKNWYQLKEHAPLPINNTTLMELVKQKIKSGDLPENLLIK